MVKGMLGRRLSSYLTMMLPATSVVGSTSQSDIRFLGVKMSVTWEVIDYDRPYRIGVKTVEGPVLVKAGYNFEEVSPDQSKVTVHGEADLEGIFDLAEPLVERMAQRQWDASFENLKDVLED